MADARSTTARRSFIARAAGAIAAWPVVRWRTRDALAHIATSPTATQPNDATLRALGDAVLPTELRPEGVARAAAEFRRWMDGYRPGAEANHGYGTGTIETLPADPRPAWQQQLAALDADARRASGGSFSALSREQRRPTGILSGEER